jgi:hypothetical protein
VPQKKAKPCQTDPAVYQEVLLKLSQEFKALSGRVKVHVETERGSASFTGDLYAQSPGRLHFDILGFLNRPRFVLIKDDEIIAWKDFDSGRSYMGPLEACPGFPGEFPFSPLFLRDFMRILFLNFPGPFKILPGENAVSPCDFTLTCRWGTFDVTMDPQVGLPVFLKGPRDKADMFQITFADYFRSSGLDVPREYEIVVKDVRMTFTFKTLQINPRISEEVFVPLVPK